MALTAAFVGAVGCGGSSDQPSSDAASQDAPASDMKQGSDGAAESAGDVAPDGGAESAPGDTWTSYAKGFFETYCNKCHNKGGSGYRSGALDFTMYDKVKAVGAEIRCGTAPTMQSGCGSSPKPKQFPIGSGPLPGDAERLRLIAWIDSGMPP